MAFSLYFFDYDEKMSIAEVYDKILENKICDNFDRVWDGDFPDLDSINSRINNRGSRWIFYPNVFILKDGELVSIYFENGLNLEGEDFYKFQLSKV